MGSAVMKASVPIVPPPAPEKPKRKRKRKPPDYSRLILPRTGRLTRAYWLLREGFVQDVRQVWCGNQKVSDWRTNRYIGALVAKGYLEQVKGPRGGNDSFRTTAEGAFAMLLAEGQHEAKKQARTHQTIGP